MVQEVCFYGTFILQPAVFTSTVLAPEKFSDVIYFYRTDTKDNFDIYLYQYQFSFARKYYLIYEIFIGE